MAENKNIEIGGRLHSIATGNVVAGADEILYEPTGGTPKKQSEVNVETYEHVANIDAAIQELSPDQTEALALATDVNDLKDNVVRSDAQTLTDAQKAQALANVGISGIDNEPTAGSENPVKSGGVATSINMVYSKTDRLNTQINGEDEEDYTSMLSSGSIHCSSEIGEKMSTTVSPSSWEYAKINVKSGSKFLITVRGGTYDPAYVVIDINNIILAKSSITTYNTFELTIPDGASQLIINHDPSKEPSIIKCETIGIEEETETNKEDIQYLSDEIDGKDEIDYTSRLALGSIACTADVGSYISGAVTPDNVWKYAKIEVNEGETFTLKLRGGSSYPAYIILNSSNIILDKSTRTNYATFNITIPAGGTQLYINDDPTKGTPQIIKSGIPGIKDKVEFNSDDIDDIKKATGHTIGIDDVEANNGYIDNEGAIQAGTSYHYYVFDNNGYKKVGYTIGSFADRTVNAVSFYSGDISENNFISGVSMAASISQYTETVDIPNDCVKIVICNAHIVTYSPVVSFDNGAIKYSKDDIISQNKDIEHIILSSSAFNGSENVSGVKTQHKYLTIVHASDMHNDRKRCQRIVDFMNYYDIIDAAVLTGDFCKDGFYDDGFELTYRSSFTNKKPMLYTLGNHDIGVEDQINTFKDRLANITYINTIQGCIDRFITPYINDYGGIGNNGYYYRDFTDYNIRFIVLNEYEMPRIANTSTKYKYSLWDRYLSQEQITWLCNVLNSVQSGWSVVVVLHQLIDGINRLDCKFNSPIAISSGDYRTAQSNIIQEIIDAYINRSTLNKTFTNTKGYDNSEVPDVNVDVDFSSANGQFMCYLSGHTHIDCIGDSSVSVNKQLNLCVTSGSAIYKAYYDDIERAFNSKSQDCFNVLIFDTDKKKIRIIRVGANTTLDMKYRDIESISYVNN